MSWTTKPGLSWRRSSGASRRAGRERGVDGEHGAGLVRQRLGVGGELGRADARGIGDTRVEQVLQLVGAVHRVAVRIARTPTQSPTAAVSSAAANPYTTVRSTMVPANSARSASTM